MAEPALAEKACDLAMCKCNAAAPGCSTPQQGDRLEDLGYESFNLGWHEADQLARVLDAIEDKRDVEDLVDGLLDDENDG